MDIHINNTKGHRYISPSAVEDAVRTGEDITTWETGVPLLGAWVGDDITCDAFLQEAKMKEVKKLEALTRLESKGLSTQDAFLLITFSFNPMSRVGYLLRCMPPHHTTHALGGVDEFMRVCFASLIKVPDTFITKTSLALIHLPINYGGMGITSVAVSAPLSYSASVDACGRVTDVLARDPRDQVGNGEVQGPVISLQQQSLNVILGDVRGWPLTQSDKLMRLYGGVKEKYNISGAYISAIPSYPSLIISDEVYINETRLRIAIDPRIDQMERVVPVPAQEEVVGNMVVSRGHDICHLCQDYCDPVHPCICGQVHAEQTWRHDGMRDFLAKELQSHGYPGAKEVRPYDGGRPVHDDGRRPDIEYKLITGGPIYAIDVAITSDAIHTMERSKTTKHSGGYAAGCFYPVVYDSLGRVGPRGQNLFQRVLHYTRDDKIRHSVAFHRANSHMLTSWRNKGARAMWRGHGGAVF